MSGVLLLLSDNNFSLNFHESRILGQLHYSVITGHVTKYIMFTEGRIIFILLVKHFIAVIWQATPGI